MIHLSHREESEGRAALFEQVWESVRAKKPTSYIPDSATKDDQTIGFMPTLFSKEVSNLQSGEQLALQQLEPGNRRILVTQTPLGPILVFERFFDDPLAIFLHEAAFDAEDLSVINSSSPLDLVDLQRVIGGNCPELGKDSVNCGVFMSALVEQAVFAQRIKSQKVAT